LIATHSLEMNPTTASLLREADKILFCLHAGKTFRGQIRKAVRAVGAQRCLGAILVDEDGVTGRVSPV
jgi:hypothetical protein